MFDCTNGAPQHRQMKCYLWYWPENQTRRPYAVKELMSMYLKLPEIFDHNTNFLSTRVSIFYCHNNFLCEK